MVPFPDDGLNLIMECRYIVHKIPSWDVALGGRCADAT